MTTAANLEAILAQGHDSASLRFALAARYLADGNAALAVEHAAVAVKLDADYSAAWRLLGQAQTEVGLLDEAVETYTRGIEAAERRGDQQVRKEMSVFLRRLKR